MSISWFRQRTHITKVLGSPLGRHQPGPQAPVPTPHPTVPQNSPRLSRAPQTKRKKIYLLRSRRKSPCLCLAPSGLHGRPGARGSSGPGQEEEALQGTGANCSRARGGKSGKEMQGPGSTSPDLSGSVLQHPSSSCGGTEAARAWSRVFS